MDKRYGIKSLVLELFCLLLYLTRPEYMLAFIPAVAYAFMSTNPIKRVGWHCYCLLLLSY